MRDAASVVTDQFADLLERLPAGLDLDRLALETKAIQRRRELVDGATLLRIALARGPGGLSLRQTAAWASMLGIADLSNPGVKYRLNQAAGFLAALVERLPAAKAPGAELRWPGRTLRLADGTCVSKPGSTGTDWRIHGVFDLGRGGFSHLELTDQHGGEALLNLRSNAWSRCCISTSCRRGPGADRKVGSTPTSFWPCCATTSARTSWNLPLRTCSTQPTSRHFGRRRRPC